MNGKIMEKLELITDEMAKISQTKFTGKVTLEINMTQGGIGQISMNAQRILTKQTKTQT